MSDTETTVLYTLSTLAQTCAALAAFVGAVGLFRLQSFRDQHRDAERELNRKIPGEPTAQRCPMLSGARRSSPSARCRPERP